MHLAPAGKAPANGPNDLPWRLATPVEEDGQRFYLLDAAVHRALAESLSERRLPLRAAAAQPAGG